MCAYTARFRFSNCGREHVTNGDRSDPFRVVCDGQERLRLHGLVHTLQATLQETEGDLMGEQHHHRDLNAQMEEAEVGRVVRQRGPRIDCHECASWEGAYRDCSCCALHVHQCSSVGSLSVDFVRFWPTSRSISNSLRHERRCFDRLGLISDDSCPQSSWASRAAPTDQLPRSIHIEEIRKRKENALMHAQGCMGGSKTRRVDLSC